MVGAILRNEGLGEKMILSVLKRTEADRKSSSNIIRAIIQGVTKNHHSEAILQALVPRLDVESITDEAVNEIASRVNLETIQPLLDRKSSPGITRAIIQGAVKNRHSGAILQVLVPRLDVESITDEVVSEIVSPANSKTMQALLGRKSSLRIPNRDVFTGVYVHSLPQPVANYVLRPDLE